MEAVAGGMKGGDTKRWGRAYNKRDRGFHPGQALFVAVVRVALKEKDYKFIYQGEYLEILAEACSVNHNLCDMVRAKI